MKTAAVPSVRGTAALPTVLRVFGAGAVVDMFARLMYARVHFFISEKLENDFQCQVIFGLSLKSLPVIGTDLDYCGDVKIGNNR